MHMCIEINKHLHLLLCLCAYRRNEWLLEYSLPIFFVVFPESEGRVHGNHKKWKTKEHPGNHSTVLYVCITIHVHTSNLFGMHMCTETRKHLQLLVCTCAYRTDEWLLGCSSVYQLFGVFAWTWLYICMRGYKSHHLSNKDCNVTVDSLLFRQLIKEMHWHNLFMRACSVGLWEKLIDHLREANNILKGP